MLIEMAAVIIRTYLHATFPEEFFCARTLHYQVLRLPLAESITERHWTHMGRM